MSEQGGNIVSLPRPVEDAISLLREAERKGELTGFMVITRGRTPAEDKMIIHGFSYLEAVGTLEVVKETIHELDMGGFFDERR